MYQLNDLKGNATISSNGGNLRDGQEVNVVEQNVAFGVFASEYNHEGGVFVVGVGAARGALVDVGEAEVGFEVVKLARSGWLVEDRCVAVPLGRAELFVGLEFDPLANCRTFSDRLVLIKKKPDEDTKSPDKKPPQIRIRFASCLPAAARVSLLSNGDSNLPGTSRWHCVGRSASWWPRPAGRG